jgi:hypothetical protein
MQESPARRSPNIGSSARRSARTHSELKENLRAFLRRLNGSRSSMPTAIGSDGTIFGRRSWWLSYCMAQAQDTSTLEEALKWEARIVRELTRRIEIVSKTDWGMTVKTSLIFDLMHERIARNAAILNIDRAIQREEDVDWQWW